MKILLCGHQFLPGFYHLIWQHISHMGKQCSTEEYILTNQSLNKKNHNTVAVGGHQNPSHYPSVLSWCPGVLLSQHPGIPVFQCPSVQGSRCPSVPMSRCPRNALTVCK